MGIVRLFPGRNRGTDGTPERSMYWCTDCGMVFERSSRDIDYAWCRRCGTESVRELPWPAL
jgi:uncharacterized paraquat-inducible protein A